MGATMAGKTAKRRTQQVPKPQTQRPKEFSLNLYKAFVRAHGEQYLKDGNITGLGVGYKTVGGKPTDQLSVQFTVAQKVSPESVERVSAKPIPKTIAFRGQTILTDVVERSFTPGYIVVQSTDKSDRKTRRDPIVAGVSVANASSTAGTLGALVRDRTSGETVMLSNWPVLHTPDGRIGDVIVQPGPFDDNRIEANRVGRLLRSHLGAAGDCALASVEGRKIDPHVLGIPGAGIIARVGKPALGDRVLKSGRTTGVTYGVVTRVDTLTRIQYGSGVTANIGGFEIGPDAGNPAPNLEISKGGDSGAAWIAVAAGGAITASCSDCISPAIRKVPMGNLRSLSRAGIDFKIDERGSLSGFQIDDELYSDNPFDRGHVARRADLCWGPLTEARQGNRDSFFFSNITPQHARFNQGMRGGLWGRLEDAIFNDVSVSSLRVSLMGGPILRDSDPEYRHLAQVPREFWKMVAYADDADGGHKVRAFVLTQRDLVKAVIPEILELEEFRWYQVPLTRIESETGVRFAASLKALDDMPPQPQGLERSAVRPIADSADFFS